MNLNNAFRKFAAKAAEITGRAQTFIISLVIVAIWAIVGPFYNYSDTWQLFINTSTTVLTLFMVFIIQNTQNRDSKAQHLKLDELIKSLKGTSHDRFVKVEELPDDEIEELQEKFRKLHDKYTETLEKRKEKRRKK